MKKPLGFQHLFLQALMKTMPAFSFRTFIRPADTVHRYGQHKLMKIAVDYVLVNLMW